MSNSSVIPSSIVSIIIYFTRWRPNHHRRIQYCIRLGYIYSFQFRSFLVRTTLRILRIIRTSFSFPSKRIMLQNTENDNNPLRKYFRFLSVFTASSSAEEEVPPDSDTSSSFYYSAIDNDNPSLLPSSLSTSNSGTMNSSSSSTISKNSLRQRIFYLNRSDQNAAFRGNKVINTKFTVFTFLPKMLLQQFSAPMNLYFLLIAILQLWSTISPVNPITTWAPLILVFLVACIREGIDDRKRAAADAIANSRPYTIYQQGKFISDCRAENIKVGDLVMINDDEEIPCDLFLLRTANVVSEGVAYLETANLDGETDLKTRKAKPEFTSLPNDELCTLQGKFECEPPNADLYRFEANVKLLSKLSSHPSNNNPLIIQYTNETNTPTFSGKSSSSSLSYPATSTTTTTEQSLVITNEQLLQHGTILRKTGWILGLVIYTGADTKLSQNKTGAPTKTSKSDILINRIVIGIFLIQLTLVAILGILGTHWKGNENDNYWYLGWDDLSEGNEALTTVSMINTSLSTPVARERPWYIIWILPLRFLLLSSMFIPISLKVSLDILKVYYGKLIANDLALYDEETDTPATVANTDIGEDLGKIDVVLSDKTGTLTENIMALCNVSIGGQIYGRTMDSSSLHNLSRTVHQSSSSTSSVPTDHENGTPTTLPQQPLLSNAHVLESSFSSSPKGPITHSDLSDPALVHALSDGKPDVLDFFRALALCNTVAPEHVNAVPMSPMAEKWSTSAGKRPRKSSVNGRESFSNGSSTGAGETPAWDEITGTVSDGKNSNVNNTMVRFIAEVDSMDDETSLLSSNHQGILYSPKPTINTMHNSKVNENVDHYATPSHGQAPFYQLRKRCIQYASSSPDEEALVHAAARIGVALTHRRVLAGDVQRVSLRYNTDIINWNKSHASSSSSSNESSRDKPPSRFHPQHHPRPPVGTADRERLPSYSSTDDEKDVIAGLNDDDPSTKRVWVTDTQPEVIYDILCVLPFTSDRRRMSVIVRRIDGGLLPNKTNNNFNSNAFTIEGNDLMVITKGADDMLRPRLSVNNYQQSTETNVSITQRLAYKETENHLETFAQRGLRTLLVAAKPLSQQEYDQWRPLWDNAMHEIGKSKELAITKACDLIEKDLCLLGATAIEDRLQDGVPETISSLRAAGISVWMLTGDKWSTAIQIAQAAHLLELPNKRTNDIPTTTVTPMDSTGTKLIEIHGGASADIERDLMTAYRTLRTMRKEQEQQESSSTFSDNRDDDHVSSPEVTLSVPLPKSSNGGHFPNVTSWLFSSVTPHILASKSLPKPIDATLVIEGSALPDILTDKQHISAFTTLALSCSSVICCRCTPAQKASLVSLVKSTGALALAIGDGGNDVAMIQAANVGIGISGREGQQAARASDYAIAKFCYLLPLIFVHGRFSNYRTALVSGYTIYKSAALAIVQLLSNINCGFSGCSLFDTYALTTYNMVYTAIPGLALALDMDYSQHKLLTNPLLYKDSRFSPWYTPRWCLGWGFRALYQGFIIYTFAMMGLGGNLSGWFSLSSINGNNYDGSTGDISLVSASAFTALVLVQFLTLTTEVYGLTYINNIVNMGGFILYMVLLIVRNYWPSSSSSLGVITAMAQSRSFSTVFTIIISVIAAVLPFIFVRVWYYASWRKNNSPHRYNDDYEDIFNLNNGNNSSTTEYVPLNTANAPSRPSLGTSNTDTNNGTKKKSIFASFLASVNETSKNNNAAIKNTSSQRRTVASSPDTEAGYTNNTTEVELRPFLSYLYDDKNTNNNNNPVQGTNSMGTVPGTSSKDPFKKTKYSID